MQTSFVGLRNKERNAQMEGEGVPLQMARSLITKLQKPHLLLLRSSTIFTIPRSLGNIFPSWMHPVFALGEAQSTHKRKLEGSSGQQRATIKRRKGMKALILGNSWQTSPIPWVCWKRTYWDIYRIFCNHGHKRPSSSYIAQQYREWPNLVQTFNRLTGIALLSKV